MNIGIIDCGGANLNSIYYSFKRININAFITNSITELRNMDAYVLPGVGSAGIIMNKLKEKNLINLNRQFLHAKIIGFMHPKKNKEMIFNSVLPQELEIILKMLRKPNK